MSRSAASGIEENRSVGRDEAEAGFLEVAIERERSVEPTLTHRFKTHRVNEAQFAPACRNQSGYGFLVQFASDPLHVDDRQEIVGQHADGGAAEPTLVSAYVSTST